MDQEQTLAHWYAYIYDQQETQTDDVQCLLRMIGDGPRRVLEVACGTGRICVPLARAGHDVEGFDLDEAALARAQAKAEALPNLRCYRADALAQPWAAGFDVVVLAGNLLVNIVTDGDYAQGQRMLLRRAGDCLATGGRLFLDFDCADWPDRAPGGGADRVIFEGVDDRGTHGRFIACGGGYDSAARRTYGEIRRFEIAPKDGEAFVRLVPMDKHFPALEQVCAWLGDAGLTVERLHGGYEGQAFDEGHRRAVIWARRV